MADNFQPRVSPPVAPRVPLQTQPVTDRPVDYDTNATMPAEATAQAPLERVPLGRRSPNLAAPARAGFYRRWFNDTAGRIQDALGAGYTHVMRDGSKWSRAVGTRDTAHGGGGLLAYLMELPNEYYNADFEAKQESLDAVDNQMYNGTFKADPGDNRYVPKGVPNKFDVRRGPGERTRP